MHVTYIHKLPVECQFGMHSFLTADLSLIAAGALGEECGDTALGFDADFALGDVMNTDPILTFEPGIT